MFTVTKSNTDAAASVEFATANGTATAPGDYAAQSGTLNFAPGEATKTITVLVNGDAAFEADETFTVNLSNPTARRSPTAREWARSRTTTPRRR